MNGATMSSPRPPAATSDAPRMRRRSRRPITSRSCVAHRARRRAPACRYAAWSSRTKTASSTPMTSAGMPNRASVACQPKASSSAPPTNGTSDGADVAAADVRADGEAAPLLREGVGEERVADRVLRAGADARHADRGQQLGDRLRQPADEEAGAEDELAAGEERRARDVAGQEAVGELHRAADRGGDGDEGADVALGRARTRR